MSEENNAGEVASEVATPETETSPEVNIAELLAYDPFEPKAAQSAASGDEKVEKAEVKPDTKPGAKAPEAGKTEAEPEPVKKEPVPSSDLAALRATLEDLVSTRRSEPEAKPAAKPPANRFNISVPDELVTGLRSEDPAEARAATGALVNGMMNAVWAATQDWYTKEALPGIQKLIDSSSNRQTSQKRIHDDFYGANPELNQEAYKPLIYAMGIQLAQEKGRSFSGWNAAFQKELAERAKAIFKITTAEPEKPAAKSEKKQPFAAGTGSRPTNQKGPSNDIMDTLGLA